MTIGLITVIAKPFLAVVLIPISLFILTGKSGIEIDLSSRQYRSYYSFYLLKFGKWLEFHSIEKIYINKNNVSQKIYTAHTNQSSTFHSSQYDAYIKFGNGEKEYLASSKDLQKVTDKIEPLSKAVGISIVDNSVSR